MTFSRFWDLLGITLVAGLLVTATVIGNTRAARGSIGATPTPVIVIDDNPGGLVDTHIFFFQAIRDSGVPVRLRGQCLSACTMILMLPREQVCAEHTAVLGFHAMTQGPMRVPEITLSYWRRHLPEKVVKWLVERANHLTGLWVFLGYDQLVADDIMSPCHP